MKINVLKHYATTAMITPIGKAKRKRYWGINMGESIQLYLDTYPRID